MLFRFHLLTYLLYLVVVSIEETFAYSGYTIMPTSFFLGRIARHVDMHLITSAQGNFAPWGILDWICGTAVGDSPVEDDLLDELEDREVESKVKRALEASKRKVREGTLRRNTTSRQRRMVAD